MKQHFAHLIIIWGLITQTSYGQSSIPDCYKTNKDEFDKVSLNRLTDIRLKSILKPFFILSDTDYSPLYFIDYKPKVFNDSVVYFNIETGLANGYEILIKSQRFDSNNHQFTKTVSGDICLIDNKIFWGTDGSVPDGQLTKLEVKLGKIIIPILSSEYKDLFNPSLFLFNDVRVSAKMDKKGEYFVIVLFGSDGAGAYTAIWIFKNGKYIGRVVASSC